MKTTKIELIQGDITTLEVDAIVNAANSSLMGGGGVDGAIHRVGGAVIREECEAIIRQHGKCKTGEAVITHGGNLPATFVIHTVGPVWGGGYNQEAQLLASCYRNSVKVAIKNKCRTIAFPNISTGIYGYPKDQAAAIAVSTIADLIESTEIEKVIFVCFDQENYLYMANLLREDGKSA